MTRLKVAGFRLYAISCGAADAVVAMPGNGGMSDHFFGIVSTDHLSTSEANPVVYRPFLKESEPSDNGAWLVSSNPFDVIGAISAGMHATCDQRSKDSNFDPWGIEDTVMMYVFNITKSQTFDFPQVIIMLQCS